MDQSRMGTDCVEHHFGNIRSKNQNPSARLCQQLTPKSAAVRSYAFKFNPKTNTSGKNVVYTGDVFASLPKKRKPKKQRK